ncbi:hypothetical protein HK104_010288 [Borealophlyctis nickersoniae]|nr:hypothetical protein HK104_010288 [Borealophlyctis nickersoniae]
MFFDAGNVTKGQPAKDEEKFVPVILGMAKPQKKEEEEEEEEWDWDVDDGRGEDYIVVDDAMLRGVEVNDKAEVVGAGIVGQVVQYGKGNRTYLQMFRIAAWNGLKNFVREPTQNFEWCKMALHHGDWEHITIQLERSYDGGDIEQAPKIDKIFFGQHGGGTWHPSTSLTFHSTHPVSYASLNSHALYPSPGTHKNADDTFSFVSRIAPLLTLGAVQWIQIADVVDLQTDLYTFEGPEVVWGRFITWRTWETVYDMTGKVEEVWDEWMKFQGRWGTMVDQTDVGPPPVGVIARNQLHAAVRTAQSYNLLKNFVRKDKAPKGPRQHISWYTLDEPKSPSSSVAVQETEPIGELAFEAAFGETAVTMVGI